MGSANARHKKGAIPKPGLAKGGGLPGRKALKAMCSITVESLIFARPSSTRTSRKFSGHAEAHASPRTPARTQKHSCWASLTVDEDMPQNKMKQHSKNSAAEWNHAIQRNRWRLQLSAVLERFSDAKRLQRPLISLDFERPSLPS